MAEWEKYRIDGDPAKAGTELDIVRHIAHVPHARRIGRWASKDRRLLSS
jgi:hypothetical protein